MYVIGCHILINIISDLHIEHYGHGHVRYSSETCRGGWPWSGSHGQCKLYDGSVPWLGLIGFVQMRDNMRMSQDKRRMSAMQFKQERYQMEQEMNHLRMQLSSSDRERQAIAVQLREMQLHCQNIKDQFEARDVENSLNETEMADQILQSEKQIEQLKSSNLLLVR